MNLKPIAINAALVIGSVCFVFISVEAALMGGIIEYQQEEKSEEVKVIEDGNTETFHPKYGWTGPANAKMLRKDTSKQPWTEYTYDSQGFRNNYHTNSDNHTIILGDSFTEGVLTNDNSTYPYLLDRWTPNQDVINYGIGGYSTEQSLRIYLDRGSEITHDTVVYTHYNGNDMIDNVKNSKKRPKFNATENGAELTREPQNVSVELNKVRLVQNQRLRQVIDFLKTHTHTYPFFEPKVRGVLVEVGLADSTLRSVPTDEELQNQTTKTRSLIQELKNEADRNNAELVIVSIPTRGDVRPDRPHKFVPADAQQYGEVQRELLRDFAASHNNVTYQPMKPILKQEVAAGNRMYGIHDGHLDDDGYCVTATTVYEHLTENGNIKKQSLNSFGDMVENTSTVSC